MLGEKDLHNLLLKQTSCKLDLYIKENLARE